MGSTAPHPQEYENAVRLFKGDPYGCHSPVLQQKRLGRNPFRLVGSTHMQTLHAWLFVCMVDLCMHAFPFP